MELQQQGFLANLFIRQSLVFIKLCTESRFFLPRRSIKPSLNQHGKCKVVRKHIFAQIKVEHGQKSPFPALQHLHDGKLLTGLKLACSISFSIFLPLLFELWLLWRHKYANTDISMCNRNKDSFIMLICGNAQDLKNEEQTSFLN